MDCSTSSSLDHHPLDDDLNNETSTSSDSNSNETETLRKKLTETEEKLMKFKNFVVTLRNERNQLKEK
ncbi:hypothetical protein BLA29_014943, partial [Euroglyphus maynei]